jgi:hypothetical protein
VELGAIARAAGTMLLRPVTAEGSLALIRRRMAQRPEMFLATIRATIFEYPLSPYHRLFRAAGCSYGDIKRLVASDGVEGALDALRRAGVYLTFDEFRGDRDVVRGSERLRFSADEFDNPRPGVAGVNRTGGTRSTGTRVQLRLDHIAEQRAPALWAALVALEAVHAPIAIWQLGMPTGPGPLSWMMLAQMHRPPARWFAMHDPHGPSTAARHRAGFRAAQAFGMLTGLRIPFPEFAPVCDPTPVLDGVTALLDAHGRALLITTPSASVRVAAAAGARGRSLRGLRVLAGGEPLTAGKHAEVTASGAWIGSHYVFTEGGSVGYACAEPEAPDDVHFLEDSFALLQHRREWPLVGEVDALMLTSLTASSPKVMINVEIDDFAQVTRRACGCVLGALGLHTHLSSVRSFTKLTGEGTTVWGTDVVRTLEEVLPREFGGRSIDYQLLETEDHRHVTRLLLLVSPGVGGVDEAALLRRFKESVWGTGARGAARCPHVWQQGGTIQVARREPVPTAGGKLLPFHTLALTTPSP